MTLHEAPNLPLQNPTSNQVPPEHARHAPSTISARPCLNPKLLRVPPIRVERVRQTLQTLSVSSRSKTNTHTHTHTYTLHCHNRIAGDRGCVWAGLSKGIFVCPSKQTQPHKQYYSRWSTHAHAKVAFQGDETHERMHARTTTQRLSPVNPVQPSVALDSFFFFAINRFSKDKHVAGRECTA